MNTKINDSARCAGCGEPFPCSDSARTDLRGDVRATHHRMNAKVNLDKPLPTSGYTPCACRDCFDLSISSDVRHPELCSPCKDAGCMPVVDHRDGDAPGHRECQRDDAYDVDLDCECDHRHAEPSYDPDRYSPFR